MTLTKPYKSWGHQLLDEVRAGSQRYSEAEITEALRATGDIGEHEYPRVVHRPVGTWEGCRVGRPAVELWRTGAQA